MRNEIKLIRFSAIILLCILQISGCNDDSPTEPDPLVEIEESFIPWDSLSGKITYTYQSSDSLDSYLCVIDTDTRSLEILAKHQGLSFNHLSLCPIDDIVTYAKTNLSTSISHLYSIDISNGAETHLNSQLTYVNYDFPAWSDQYMMAYLVNGTLNNITYYRTVFVNNQPFYQDTNTTPTRPAWKPGGDFLVVSTEGNDQVKKLVAVDIEDSTTEIILTDRCMDLRDPVYSPDGSKIAYARLPILPNNPGQTEIWIINNDGSDRMRLTSEAADSWPTWSPDGNSIIFVRSVFTISNEYEPRLFLVNIDGTGLTQITSQNGNYPSWTD